MQLIINEQNKELKQHGSYAFPVRLSHESLDLYEQETFSWHWHPEIELTYILQGEMIYQINQTEYHMHAGEALFCNSNALHTGHSVVKHMNCEYMSLTFHPRVLYGYEGSEIEMLYVRPITEQTAISSIHLTDNSDWEKEIIDKLKEIIKNKNENQKDFALKTQIALLEIWLQIYQHTAALQTQHDIHGQKDIERLRLIFDYIHEHFSEPVTLEEIADQVSLCKSECCRFFKNQTNQTIFEYLTAYRISQSLPLLKSGLNITEAGSACGFANPAYYSRVFKKQMGCAPRAYIRADQDSEQDS